MVALIFLSFTARRFPFLKAPPTGGRGEPAVPLFLILCIPRSYSGMPASGRLRASSSLQLPPSGILRPTQSDRSPDLIFFSFSQFFFFNQLRDFDNSTFPGALGLLPGVLRDGPYHPLFLLYPFLFSSQLQPRLAPRSPTTQLSIFFIDPEELSPAKGRRVTFLCSFSYLAGGRVPLISGGIQAPPDPDRPSP